MIDLLRKNWAGLLETVRQEYGITSAAFDTWVKPLQIHSLNESVLYIYNPDVQFDGMVDYVTNKYKLQIQVAVRDFLNDDTIEINVITTTQANNLVTEEIVIPKTVSPSKVKASLPFNSTLIPKYTFDTFVVGKNNELAHATALAVSEDPGEYGNPLFIYGGVGLGKTHLMHAIANHTLSNKPNQNILYVTSADFTNELILAIRTNKNEEFRNKYRSLDMLLVDDIQFIANRESTQEEFFNTFNALRDAKKQIILTSDKPPKDLKDIPERLISRFQNGLIVDIQAPEYETRMAILKKKAEIDHITISDECMSYVAECIKSNIRELEGALNQINNLSKLQRKPISMEIVQEALTNIISPDAARPITTEIIINIVADHFNITPSDIKSTKRSRDISYPRQICMYLSRRMTGNSLQAIGEAMCRSDHTTVIHAEKKIKADYEKDENIRNLIDLLIKKINPPNN